MPVAGSDERFGAVWKALLRSGLCRGLEPDELAAVARAMRPATCFSGEVIVRQHEPAERMFVVARGRVKLERDGAGRQVEYLGRGDQFGELALLTDGSHKATATAVMDSELLTLDRVAFDRLLHDVPGLAANLSRSLGFRFGGDAPGRPRRRKTKVVAIVRSTLGTQPLARMVVAALVEAGTSVRVVTDRPEAWLGAVDCRVEKLPEPAAGRDVAATARQRILQLMERPGRVVVDVSEPGLGSALPAVLTQCEEIWWTIDADLAETGRREIARLLERDPLLAPKLHPVWLLRHARDIAPHTFAEWELAPRDFKVVLGDETPGGQRALRQGVDRLVRHLRGCTIGLALGGGGARGLAHLGVLRALEAAGLSVDCMAGTSSGALTGVAYAAGWSPDEALDAFHRALTPPWLVRKLPRGPSAYLTYMFRTGGWDRKLRPYLGQATLDQLQIPFATVAADLIQARQVIRETGDAVHAVLESINIPPLARPILRDGMALVDGGILNNLPGDVLSARGADLVVGVDITAKVRPRFGANDPRTATALMRQPGTMETLLRVSEVQDHNLALSRGQTVDLLIAPDTSRFSFADFMQGQGLAEMGEAAAAAAAPQIKQLVADLGRE
jgi:predicted acylesterase/phospholipase RssA/CRP-like cAMP-binding protein